MANLRVMEPQEPYNTKEDLLELAQEYKDAKDNEHNSKWKRARLAQEAAQKFDLKQFAKETGENYDVLKNLSYVASRYTPEEQSNCAVTLLFEHFIVAAKDNKRLEWLKKAGDNAWSAARLRREMNPPKPKPEPNPMAEVKPITYMQPVFDSIRAPAVDPLEAAFKPFIEVFNQLFLAGELNGKPWEQQILMVFGQQTEYNLVFVEEFGWRMISLKQKIEAESSG